MTHEILLIEDNPISRKAVRAALEAEGYRIVEAADGEAGLKRMADQLPDLVLQDLLLPDINGFELVSQLRALPGAAKIPILALTGLMAKDDERRIAGAQFTDYLFQARRAFASGKHDSHPSRTQRRGFAKADQQPSRSRH